jgi:MSHA biogenesis protein MshP
MSARCQVRQRLQQAMPHPVRHPARGPMRRRLRRPARGMSSLLMLAILVTLGSLSVHAVGLITNALGDDARAVAEARAAEAAAAGLDWGRERVLRAPAVCTAAQSITTLPGTLAPYTVTVRCQVGAPVLDGGTSRRRFALTATACNQQSAGACPTAAVPNAGYVQRTMSLVLHAP